jgi:hypothetical protein
VRRSGLAIVAALFCAAPGAHAYRPFDGTDAAVADRGAIEIELGPAGVLRVGRDRFLVAPALIANAGFADGWELVLEGRQHVLLGAATAGVPRSRIVDTALNVKRVLREGALQGQGGPSVALELGMLLPTLHDEPGIGAQATGIVSNRLGPLTAHFNAGVALSRDQRVDLAGSIILEGPWTWPVRPVFEGFTGVEGAKDITVSGIAGLIWPASDALAFDAGLRVGSTAGQPLYEVRLGLTFSFGVLASQAAARPSEADLRSRRPAAR